VRVRREVTVIRNPAQPRAEGEKPNINLFPDWIKAVRELGSFALIIYLFISGFAELRATNEKLSENLNALENTQIEEREAIRALTHAIQELSQKSK
jgi:hypothetical protein